MTKSLLRVEQKKNMLPKHYIKVTDKKMIFLKNCRDNKFSKIHNCNPSQSLSVPPILYVLCYLYFLLIFWGVILMFHSIWWLFPMFKFWYISWHSSFIRRCLLLVFIRQWCWFINWAGLLLSTTVVFCDFLYHEPCSRLVDFDPKNCRQRYSQ